MLKRILCILILSMIAIFNLGYSGISIFASENIDIDNYTIYDEDHNVLFVRESVELGDNYMSSDYKYYEVIHINDDRKIGIAKFIRNVPKPNISRSNVIVPIGTEERVICMYMTHNDESYVPTDGTESVYGNGGIKDVALAFKSELEKYMVNVYFDDTLHIPHDTSAYSRSLVTAKNLQNTYSPDALFDIHRDGASRKYYIANVSGKERGRVRIVVGKANPNMALNEEFALYLMAVADELYPWLFTDIYYAKGHYNQALDSKAILFEMGSHLIEKELEIESMKELAEVVTTALYKTTVNIDTGDLTVNGVVDEDNITITEVLNEKENSQTNIFAISIVIVAVSTICVYAIIVIIKNVKKRKNK